LKPAQRQKLFAAMRFDKKVSGGEIKFVLAKRIGRVVWGQRVAGELIGRVLDEIGNTAPRVLARDRSRKS
jgi:3-dehydroquinate synthetase